MQPKLIISFEEFPLPDFLTKTEFISTSLASNISFPMPWPGGLSGPAALTALYNTFLTAFNAASTGDSIKVAQREAARTALTVFLKKLAPHLELTAAGDIAKLLSSGYSLRKSTTHTGGGDPPPVPTNFKVERGGSGQLIAKARKIRNVGAYEVQINSGDPNVEASWHSLPVQTSCAKVKINGLTPMTRVWVRLRAVNSHGPGDWTDPAGEVVV